MNHTGVHRTRKANIPIEAIVGRYLETGAKSRTCMSYEIPDPPPKQTYAFLILFFVPSQTASVCFSPVLCFYTPPMATHVTERPLLETRDKHLQMGTTRCIWQLKPDRLEQNRSGKISAEKWPSKSDGERMDFHREKNTRRATGSIEKPHLTQSKNYRHC